TEHPNKHTHTHTELVDVIPCNDQRLRPRHMKLCVAVSISVCLLVLFSLFPRSVLLSPVAVKSSFVYFIEDKVQINIKNVLNITNDNFAAVQAYNLTVQALNFDTVVETVSIKNVTSVKPLSIKTNICNVESVKLQTETAKCFLNKTCVYLPACLPVCVSSACPEPFLAICGRIGPPQPLGAPKLQVHPQYIWGELKLPVFIMCLVKHIYAQKLNVGYNQN
uniref:Transmembrane protein 106 C-terminal domain-containing protein n=1 Tax=Seriola dumerili TaxID=41447 RepID=A0A3B4V0K0_SERDU